MSGRLKEGFDGDTGTVTIGFGEPEPGAISESISSVEVEVHDDRVWAASLTVGGTREYLGYTTIDVQQSLRDLYGDIDSLELWVGGLAEDHVDGAMMGETFHTSISEQFRSLRDGDRFWFENDSYLLNSPELLSEIRSTTLADIIRRNTPIGDEIPADVPPVYSTP